MTLYALGAQTTDKESMIRWLCMETFARDLPQLLIVIDDNAVYDRALIVSEIRTGHFIENHL